MDRLVHFEVFNDIRSAIQREKQINEWLRGKKIAPIVENNPTWRDLSDGWFGQKQCRDPSLRSG